MEDGWKAAAAPQKAGTKGRQVAKVGGSKNDDMPAANGWPSLALDSFTKLAPPEALTLALAVDPQRPCSPMKDGRERMGARPAPGRGWGANGKTPPRSRKKSRGNPRSTMGHGCAKPGSALRLRRSLAGVRFPLMHVLLMRSDWLLHARPSWINYGIRGC